MKLKYSDWCFLSSKSLILTSEFPRLESYKGYLSLSPRSFLDQIKKQMDILEDTDDLELILKKEWHKTIKLFERKLPLDFIIRYFEIERKYINLLKNSTNEKRVKLLNEEYSKEIYLFKNYPFLINFVKLNIDFTNIETFLKHKYFNTPYYFISNGNLKESLFRKFEKESIDSFIDYINTKYRNFIEKDLKDFLLYFDKKKDEYIINLIKESKYFVFGPEIVFSYLKLKDYHYINLRLIYNGLIYNQSAESIIRRLRLING